eukprot:4523383-Amphidinium_carterae.1
MPVTQIRATDTRSTWKYFLCMFSFTLLITTMGAPSARAVSQPLHYSLRTNKHSSAAHNQIHEEIKNSNMCTVIVVSL